MGDDDFGRVTIRFGESTVEGEKSAGFNVLSEILGGSSVVLDKIKYTLSHASNHLDAQRTSENGKSFEAATLLSLRVRSTSLYMHCTHLN